MEFKISLKLQKMYQLYTRGATDGERMAARNRMCVILQRVGMTFEQYEARYGDAQTDKKATGKHDYSNARVFQTIIFRAVNAAERKMFVNIACTILGVEEIKLYKMGAKKFKAEVPQEHYDRIVHLYNIYRKKIARDMKTMYRESSYQFQRDYL